MSSIKLDKNIESSESSVNALENDPFYSESNQEAIKKSYQEFREGKYIEFQNASELRNLKLEDIESL